ncbi:hypothetical protein BV98_001431 [Sphingobium herbicidovorans NBRC 16415]|uniref:Uncharacterized protein n=1 Tax=Sphingobium herbicidovorans (strain ATCC 700291 / DSM 11019 / CCUG 56400 / KCTC 2939 / LMG 18315 / NBRC 16415 / MH) TaxID=1219045 RepID=A0A086PBF1_SPHHM|nr:hypothetical protein [Sphingobium herbicidovorans]KFG90719.1 hypothetical protein BV98_001431 [Sphingobium herbicidovorans NBRC 16415]
MTPWVEAAIAKYGWIAVGLTFGLAAKYALLIKRGVKVKAWLVVADILLLPMVALIAFWLVKQAGVDGEGAALLTAGATVGADRIVKLYTDRFLRQADAMMMETVVQRKAALREEVQTELSAERTLNDIATGKRPIDV